MCIYWFHEERKAKQAEQQIREIARKAREEHRLACDLQLETAYNSVAPGVPPGRQAVKEWYISAEIPRKAGLDTSNNVETWFHGELVGNFYFYIENKSTMQARFANRVLQQRSVTNPMLSCST